MIGKTFTTSLNTTNPNTYVKFIFLRTSPLTTPFQFYHGDQTTWRTSYRICCIWFILDQNPVCLNRALAWTLTLEIVLFRSKSVTQSMYIDAGQDLFWFDRINWRLTSGDFLFLWKCLHWSCLKAVLLRTFVVGGMRGSTVTGGSCEKSTCSYSKIECRRTLVFMGQARCSYLQAAFLPRS